MDLVGFVYDVSGNERGAARAEQEGLDYSQGDVLGFRYKSVNF